MPNHRSILIPILVTSVLFGVFLPKAFIVDDPLFLWTAEQILENPADFYGFTVNWYGREMPMAEVTKNPPLVGYFIAAAAFIGGWSEINLHLFLWMAGLAVAVGTWVLAREMKADPVLAFGFLIACPAFIVSSTNVMADSPALAFMIWSIIFWRRGLERNRSPLLALAGLFAAASGLCKYFGFATVPLLAATAILERRPFKRWAWHLLIPFAVVAAYEAWCLHLYGRSLISSAAEFSTSVRTTFDTFSSIILALIFSGGCALPIALLAPVSWNRKSIAPLALISVIVAATMQAQAPQWNLLLHHAVFSFGGISIAILAFAELRSRDANRIVLGLWIVGTLVFAIFLNWIVNARILLPLLPPLAIVIALRLAEHKRPYMMKVIAISAVIALALGYADSAWAASARDAARTIASQRPPQGRVWFQGHWGFQYYMQKIGGTPIDLDAWTPSPGDLVAIPANNLRWIELPTGRYRTLSPVVSEDSPWLTTMHRGMGTGYYSEMWGPVPFALGNAPPERYDLFLIP